MRVIFVMIFISALSIQSFANEAVERQCKGKEDAEKCVEHSQFAIKKGNMQMGKDLLARACGFGYARGCLKLGSLSEKLGEKEKAKEFYQKSCDLEGKSECPNVARLK